MNVFIQHLGEQYRDLDELIRRAHIGDIRLEGQVCVARGRGLANLLCSVLGMPRSGAAVHLVVHGRHTPERMIWSRRFDETRMETCFLRRGEYLIERMGPVRLWLKLRVEDGGLVYDLHKSTLFGLVLPRFFSPRLHAFEVDQDGRYRFGVRVALPLVGRLIEYGGELTLSPG